MSFKKYIAGFVLFFVLLVGILVWFAQPKPIPPLPFDAKPFVSTVMPTYGPPPTAGLFDRIRFSIFNLWLNHKRNGSTWSFPASPKRGCSIQGLLNQCGEVSGTRYLMPLGVATRRVQFGNTNVLNGTQWVAAFESALQTGEVQILDPTTRQMFPEHLALLRFPAQKTILVLPESKAIEFQRTNGIQTLNGIVK